MDGEEVHGRGRGLPPGSGPAVVEPAVVEPAVATPASGLHASAPVQQGAATAPKREPWTYDENAILLVRLSDSHCLDSRGRPKWAQVAKGLPGRTPQEARCRWRRMNDAKTRRKGGETFRNKCSTCGLSRRGHICPGVNSAAVAAYKLAALREPKLPKPAAPPPPPPPPPPPRAWPLPPGEPIRAPKAPRSSPFGEEDNAQEEGEETDGEESFHALLALFQVGRHVEPASPHHMHASIATTAALGFAEPSSEASAEQANHSVDIAAAAATIDAAAPPRGDAGRRARRRAQYAAWLERLVAAQIPWLVHLQASGLRQGIQQQRWRPEALPRGAP